MAACLVCAFTRRRPPCIIRGSHSSLVCDFILKYKMQKTSCISTKNISPVFCFQFLTRLSFCEFEELLEIGSRERLSDIDPRLRSFENMSVQWYQRLARVLVSRYSEHHRHFASSDGLIQYVVGTKCYCALKQNPAFQKMTALCCTIDLRTGSIRRGSFTKREGGKFLFFFLGVNHGK